MFLHKTVLSVMCMCFRVAIGVMDCVTCKIFFFNIFAYCSLEIVGPLSYVLYFLKCKTIFPGKYCIKFACVLWSEDASQFFP
jgi:hypothetical protein